MRAGGFGLTGVGGFANRLDSNVDIAIQPKQAPAFRVLPQTGRPPRHRKAIAMASMDEQILRASKEIVVKFIETGRVSPTSFHDTFKSIYATVQSAVSGPRETPEATASPEK